MAKNFILRKFKESDAESFINGLNTETIARNTTIDLPCRLENAKFWINFINEAEKKTPIREKHFVIEVENNLAGSIGLINIDGHKCEVGYWLIDSYKNEGIVTKVLKEVIEYGCEKLNIVRFFAPVLEHNKASIKVLEKNNFEKESVLRKYYFKNNQYVDAISYVLVK